MAQQEMVARMTDIMAQFVAHIGKRLPDDVIAKLKQLESEETNPLAKTIYHTMARNQELAEVFINYMLSEEPAIANAEYTYYASPNKAVYTSPAYIEDMGEEAMRVLYPQMESFAEAYNRYAYRNLDAATLDYINTLWEKIKIN